MNKNKFNLRNVVAVAICLVGLMAFVGCERKDDFVDNPLVGKWITAGNDNNHIEDGRIIIFTENRNVERYFDEIFPDATVIYALLGNEIILYLFEPVTREHPVEGGLNEVFEFVINGNFLTIKGFSRPFAIDAGPRFDVHFTRVQ